MIKFNQSDYHDHRGILIILISYAFFYGSFFYYFPQEAITFAKTFLGDYEFNNSNTFYLNEILKSPITLQIYFPYFLLKIGIDEEILNRIWSGLTSTISILSFFYFSKIITKSNLYSFFVVLLLLTHKFINTHFYSIHFPVSYFYFGQMGMYLCLLTISFMILKKPNLLIFILIINFFVHAAWGLFGLAFVAIYNFIKKNSLKITKINYFLLILLSVFTFLIHSDINKKKYYILYNNTVVDQLEKKPSYLESHNPYFQFEKKTIFKDILNFIKFFFFEILILLILFLRNKIKNKNLILFFKILLFLSCLSLFIYFLTNHFKPLIFFLNYININILILIDRMNITRFMNLDNISIILFTISYFFFLSKNLKLLFPKFFLTIILFLFSISILSNGYILSEHLPIIKIEKIIHNFIIYSFTGSLIFYLIFKNKIEEVLNNFRFVKIINNLYSFSLVSLFICSMIYLPIVKKIQFDSFYKPIEEDFLKLDTSKEIIVGPSIHGYIDPMYLANAPIILPIFFIYDDQDKLVDIYCNKEFEKTFDLSIEYFRYADKCLESRSFADWLDIKSRIGSKYVIVRNYVNLNLKLMAENNFLKVYVIN